MGKGVGSSMSTSHVPISRSPLSPLLQIGGLWSLPAPRTKVGKLLGPAQLDAEQ